VTAAVIVLLVAMTYPSTETDQAVCAAALAIVLRRITM
jgi:hypothetical protein